MRLKRILESVTSNKITIVSAEQIIEIPEDKYNRIWLAFLELVSGYRLNLETKTLDLTKIDESFKIKISPLDKQKYAELITNRQSIIRILQNNIFIKLEKIAIIENEMRNVDITHLYGIDINSIMTFLAYTDKGIFLALESEEISENSKKEITAARSELYKVCKHYFEQSGEEIHKFKMKKIVQFVENVLNYQN